MDFIIRNTTIKDIPAISTIKVKGWQTAYKGLINQGFLDSMKEDEMSKGWKKIIFTQKEKQKYTI